MTDLERLLAIEEIKMLRRRFSRFVDSAMWSDISGLLTEDAVLDLTDTGRRAVSADADIIQPLKGAPAICRWLEKELGQFPNQLHLVSMPEITFTSDTEAEGYWRQESHIIGAAGRNGKCGLGYGTIRDTYRRAGKGWRIRTMNLRLDLLL